MNNDADLLRRFAATQDEPCFAAVVQRHIGFVYAVSVRRLRDPHAAKDATQAVFVALARKAATVADAPSVIGWLHRSTCYETRNIMRARANRLARETEAERLGTTIPEPRPALAGEVETVLDDALCELSSADREAILARYFSGVSYAEIGTALQLSENAARMRVERALGKLRSQLARRGVTSTAIALSQALPSWASTPVPSGLVAGVTEASLGGIVTAAAGTGAIVGFMSTTKVVIGVALVAAIGAALYEFRHSSELETSLAETRAQSAALHKQVQAVQREMKDLRQVATIAAEKPAPAAPAYISAPVVAAAPDAPRPGVTPKAPQGWFKNGSANDLYEVGVDENNAWGGMPSAYARSTGAADGKFGGMMQTIAADTYRNQRVRLTGWIKTDEVGDGGAHLWMRVDGEEKTKSLAFDNMDGRAPKGTSDWQDYSIVLDVPADATKLNYGFFISGKGQMWVNGMTVTPVGADVPTTSRKAVQPPPMPKTPTNLGFAPAHN
jgi:RNA polymerase sigma factor (sigma-70 family)